MATYERSVRVAAPLAEVWDFHSTENGLEALTPDWMQMRVESVRGPDGEPDPDVLEAGSTLEASVRPFGVGPRQGWTSEITEREHDDGSSAYFRDVMNDGPFEFWEHTHLFYADGEETIITDSVAYELPLGRVGEAVGPLAVVGFEPMFRFRHDRTRELLE
jgi:ligand-binding SRPBCC domain-containing protein